MSMNFQRDDEDHLAPPRSGRLCNDDELQHINDDSNIIGDLQTYMPDDVLIPYDHSLFFPFPYASDSLFTNSQARVEDYVSAALLSDGKNNIWQPVDVPSSLPNDCLTSIASNTYDTRDFDPTDQSMLGLPSVILSDNYHATEFGSSLENLSHVANPPMPFHLENSLPLPSSGQADLLVDTEHATIMHNRKRSAEDLLDRKPALNVYVEKMLDPFTAIEDAAQRYGVPFDVVMDLCLQKRAKCKLDSLHFNDSIDTITFASLCTKSTDSSVPTEGNLAPVKEVRTSAMPTEPGKQASQATYYESGSKRYQCPICGRWFSRRADLRRHFKTHHPPEFKCQYPECKMTFTRKDKFREHMRKKHGDSNFRIEMIQRKEDDPENDPDSGPGPGGKSYQVNKHSQGRQRGESSTNFGHSNYDSSSNGRTVESHGHCEYFWPLLSNTPAVEFMEKFNHARVNRKLGQGGFGHVYECSIATEADGNHEAFACKIIRLPDHDRRAVIERARNEIRVLQVLDHPHIITFTGAFISKNEVMMSTRPVADCNLKMFLNRQSSPLSSVAKCQLWQASGGLASAIAYVHSYGIGGGFHGDIKPENILVVQDTEVKSWTKLVLADFGSATLPALCTFDGHSTQAVTPRYCAPECFANINERGPSSDIWSFGCIMTQIVTYLHDKTMADFETHRTRYQESKMDWTYSESLAIVNDWLCGLLENFREFTGSVGQSGHIALISNMLSPNPKDRSSATEIVGQFEVYSKLFTEKTDQKWNCGMTSTQLRHSTADVVLNAKCAYDNHTIAALGNWEGENSSIFHPKDAQSDIRNANSIKCAINSPQQASKRNPGMACTGMAYLKASISNFIYDTSQMYSLGNFDERYGTPVAKYGIKIHKAGEDISQRYENWTHFVRNVESSGNDSTIKLASDQIYSDRMPLEQPHGGDYALRLILESQERRSKDMEARSKFRSLKPKPDSSHHSSERKSRRSPGHRPGGRHQPLKVQSVGRIRKRIACWKCLVKNSRAYGVCNCLLEFVPSPFRTAIYYRRSLAEYTPCFFPELAYSRFSESAIGELVRKNVIGFTANSMLVEISSGPEYPTIQVMVAEFVPSNREFLSLSYVKQASAAGIYEFATSYALPLGVLAVGEENLRALCLSHIKSIVGQGRSFGEHIHGDTSIISWVILEVVSRYQKSSSGTNGYTSLLGKAGMLYAMHYFMRRLVTIPKTSAKHVATNLRSPRLLPYDVERSLTSTLLNLQIKQTMYTILREVTQDVLAGLEDLFTNNRELSSWADAFCVVLTLCMCIEESQVIIDSFIMAAERKDQTSVLHSTAIIRDLEDGMYKQVTNQFHLNYKTAESSFSRAKGLGCNPILDGFPLNESTGITQQMADFVQDIRQLMKCYEHLMREKVENPILETGPDLLTRHMAFRKRNSGRLVSKFLMSFT